MVSSDIYEVRLKLRSSVHWRTLEEVQGNFHAGKSKLATLQPNNQTFMAAGKSLLYCLVRLRITVAI